MIILLMLLWLVCKQVSYMIAGVFNNKTPAHIKGNSTYHFLISSKLGFQKFAMENQLKWAKLMGPLTFSSFLCHWSMLE